MVFVFAVHGIIWLFQLHCIWDGVFRVDGVCVRSYWHYVVSIALYFGMELLDGGLLLFESCCSQNVVARILSVEAFIVLPLDA